VTKKEGQPVVQVKSFHWSDGTAQRLTAPVESSQSSVSVDISEDAYGVAFGVFVRGFGVVDITKYQLALRWSDCRRDPNRFGIHHIRGYALSLCLIQNA